MFHLSHEYQNSRENVVIELNMYVSVRDHGEGSHPPVLHSFLY